MSREARRARGGREPASTGRRTLGLLASALGLGLLLLGGYEAAGLRARLSPSSLLIGATSVARAPDDGTLFVGSSLARVHVYSAQGRPLRGFEVPVDGAFRLAIADGGRLVVTPDDGSAPLTVDFDGTLLAGDPPAPREPASSAEPKHRIDAGNVVREESGKTRVLVRGYETHTGMLLHTLWVGLALFAGGLLLIGGVLATGSRRPS